MLLILLLSILLLRLSFVQTYLGEVATSKLNKTYNTNILVKKVELSFTGDVKLKDIEINDHQNDSLIYVKGLTTSIFSYRNILENRLELGEVTLEGVTVNMITHEGEEQDNLTIFVSKFDSPKDSTSTSPPFLLTSSKLNLKNVAFSLYDKNKKTDPIVFYRNMTGSVENFKVDGPNVDANIRQLSFNEDHGIWVKDLTTNFKYTKEQMTFEKTTFETESSLIKSDIVFKYHRDDLADFNNKVLIDADFAQSSVSLGDLSKFYAEFGKNDIINFTTKATGTLNDFKLDNLRMYSNRNSVINGDFHFKNIVNSENGFSLNAQIDNLSSTYQNLKLLLPNILGKTLPSSFDKFGRFSIIGHSYITNSIVDAQLELKSAKGTVSKHQYKGYTYSNIDVNGVFQNQRFNGELSANDENLKMKFVGLADLSSAIYKFDFKADVAYSEFNKLNLFKRDEVAILKGNMDINLTGNSIDNLSGSIRFANASYTNQNDSYFFKDFNISSQFLDTVRVITVNSTDIVNGTFRGRYRFDELGVLAKNSLGSIYTDYQPEKVTPGQFLDFNFKIYDKIIGVFFPEVSLGSNTSIKGEIDADDERFELTVRSPKVEAYKNIIENIRLQIDNKNPLYNTLLSIDKVNTENYNIADLNLVNVTLNDTLFFRTDFVGGKSLDEKFDLSFYHTLNENNQSVVGLKKSDIRFKENDWQINPTNNKQNKVVFDDKLETFAFDKINIISNEQEIDFAGVITSSNDKDVTLNLKNVKLEGITPSVDSLSLKAN